MLGFVEGEQTFSTLTFMKDKLCNKLGLHLDTIIRMFAQKFYTQESFPYHKAITTWKNWKVRIVAAS
jgi:antitoxin component of RelBE/YafQ-DinJ toxin-antitoxin module